MVIDIYNLTIVANNTVLFLRVDYRGWRYFLANDRRISKLFSHVMWSEGIKVMTSEKEGLYSPMYEPVCRLWC